MGLPAPITWPITGGIATKNAPLMLAPGSHIVLDNVRQERLNEWRTRPGFSADAADNLPGALPPVVAQESTWGGFAALVRQTTYGTAGRIFSPTAGTRWITPPNASSGAAACAQQTPGLWNRRPVGPMTTGNLNPSQVSTAEGGSYRLTAWWAKSGGGATGIQVALQTADGATAQLFPVYNADTGACRPRCVYSAAASMLVLVFQDGANQIVAHRWNATTGAFVGATTISAAAYAGVPQAAYVDAIDYGGATITICFRNNTGAGQLQIAEFNASTAAIASNVNTALDCSNNLAIFPDPDASGIRMVAICTAVPELRIIRLNTVGAIQTNQVAAAVDAFLVTGCAYNAGVDWMCVYNSASYFYLRAVKRRAGVTSAIVDITPTGRMYCALATGAWREAGTDAMRYMILGSGTAADDIQPTFLELALDFENGAATISNTWTEPQARLLSLNSALIAERGSLGQVFRLGTDKYAAALGRITQLLDVGDGLGGPQFAIDTWTVQYLNSTTYYNQNLGQGTKTQSCTFQPAGTLLQTATGQLFCSHGASAIPFEPALTPSVGAGSLNPAKTYIYGVSVYMPDENGNAWRSPMSVTKSILPGGANNTVTVDVKLTPLENQQRRRVALLWRSDGDGSTLKLLHVLDGTVATTGAFTYVDLNGDPSGGELRSGEAQTGLTPAFIHTVLWNDRLWGVDRDFPTKIWFTKPLSSGLLPEFVADPDTGLEFSIDIDDQYGPITGMAAMDDRIVVTKERATYVLGGDGPDNVGNGSFPATARISSEIGHVAGAPIAALGKEVYIVSLAGAQIVSGGQEIQFIDAIDKYLSMPLLATPEIVKGMVVSPGMSEVRIQTTNYRFVHDRTLNVWLRDTGGMAAASGIVMTRMLDGKTQVMFTSAGAMWREAADTVTPTDAGTAYRGAIESAWVRPNGPEGWIRLHHARVLGEVTAVGVVAQPTFTVFYDNDDTFFEAFTPLGQIANDVGPIRADAQVRNQRCSTFKLRLDLPLGDASVRLDAWSAAATVIPAIIPLPVNQKWHANLASGAAPASPCPDCPPSPPVYPDTFKSWKAPVTVSNAAQGNATANTHDIVFRLVNALIALGWTTKGSAIAGSAGMDGVYRFATFNDWIASLGVPNTTWWVGENGAGAQLLIQNLFDSGADYANYAISYSPDGGFVGGSTTVRPTAPHMIDMVGASAYWGSGGGGHATETYTARIICSTDVKCTRVLWSTATRAFAFWGLDQARGAKAGWSTNYFMNDLFQGLNSVNQVGGLIENFQGVPGISEILTYANGRVIGGGGGGTDNMFIPNLRTGNNGNNWGQSDSVLNGFTGKYDVLPVALGVPTSATAAIRGLYGLATDMVILPKVSDGSGTPKFTSGSTAPLSGTRAWITWGDLLIPWGGGVVGADVGDFEYFSMGGAL